METFVNDFALSGLVVKVVLSLSRRVSPCAVDFTPSGLMLILCRNVCRNRKVKNALRTHF
jgi:hypothetical protein